MNVTPRLRGGRVVRARALRPVLEDGAEHDLMLARCIAHEQRRVHRPRKVRREVVRDA